MRKLFLPAFAAASLLFMDFALISPAHVDTYKLDTQTSSLEWKGEKLTGSHFGAIQFSSGTLSDNHGTVSGKFEADMQSITVKDLEGESKTKLETHLKSADFFDVQNFPKSSFAITALKPLGANAEGHTHAISGNLTIKNKTNPVVFNAKFSEEPGKLRFTGAAKIDRSKFDVRYRSKSFFPDIGDKLIYDEFTLNFNVALVKQ